uniref:CheW-like domain-containing protein n=1 Tax=candidate division WOR-3 bacterium TaxID=2052148 RepID=A0A7V0Z6N4_UNCW3
MAIRSKKDNKGKIKNPASAFKSPVKKLEEEKGYAVFAVGNEFYCVDLDSIFEILHDFVIVPASHLPEHFEGVINLRGESIPAVNLKKLLNIVSDTNFQVCIVSISASEKIGFLVDSDVEIIKSSECQSFAMPDCFSAEEQKFLEGIIEYKGRLTGIIKLNQALKTLTEWRSKNENK